MALNVVCLSVLLIVLFDPRFCDSVNFCLIYSFELKFAKYVLPSPKRKSIRVVLEQR